MCNQTTGCNVSKGVALKSTQRPLLFNDTGEKYPSEKAQVQQRTTAYSQKNNNHKQCLFHL